MSNSTTLAERIIEARETRGLTVHQATQRMAVKAKTFHNWETGQTTPSPSKLQMLSGVLGVPLFWLINGSADHDPMNDDPSRLDQLEQKVKRMNLLHRELYQLSTEIAKEVAIIRQMDADFEELVA